MIQNEKITDDKGREINFKRPDGDRLPRTQMKSVAKENFSTTEAIYEKQMRHIKKS